MAKSYTEELATWVKTNAATRPRQDKNVVAFLAVRNDIMEAIEAGYAIKTIWEHLHEIEKIPYRYETFLKHIRRHIKLAPTNSGPTAETVSQRDQGKSSKPGKKASTAKPKELKRSESPLSGFTFDAKPKEEDLI